MLLQQYLILPKQQLGLQSPMCHSSIKRYDNSRCCLLRQHLLYAMEVN
jgi:hypothetical protein